MNEKITQYNKAWITQRADPYVYRHSDGTYYFTASVPAYDKIILRHADSLMGLRDAKETDLWVKHDNGIMSKHIWAPELHYINNHWYIYFAAGELDNIWRIRPYVLECLGDDPMCDGWKELGMMKACDEDEFSFHSFSLDGTVFEHNNEWYYIWAEKTGVGKMISNLYIAKLERPDKLATVQVLLTTPDYDWERVGFWVNEGPAVIQKNGKIYVTFSASATGACYSVGMLTADENADLLDPRSWKKDRYPVLISNEEYQIFGPGHNSFTTDENGADIMVYHARQYEHIEGESLYDPNRHAMIMKVIWDNQGRPIFDFQNNLKF